MAATNESRVTRRHFMSAVGAAAAVPYIIPASAIGGEGRPAPSAEPGIMYGVAAAAATPFRNERRVARDCWITIETPPLKDVVVGPSFYPAPADSCVTVSLDARQGRVNGREPQGEGDRSKTG